MISRSLTTERSVAILGLDIGGANLKAADLSGKAISRPFPIWREWEQLPDALELVLREFPETDRIALTMTAELADCFSTKSEGVQYIANSVDAVARRFGLNDSEESGVYIWTTDGRFISPAEASKKILKVAASNWHALATWTGRLMPRGFGLLIDIGTTTTDIIPIVDEKPASTGFTDVERLRSGELSYSGVWRTPLCAIAHSVPVENDYCPLAAELFATTLDIYLLLDQIPEDPQNTETANGKSATKSAAHDRVARMLCCDRDELPFDQAVQVARFLADVQRQRLAGSLERVLRRGPTTCEAVVISGSGDFLAEQLVRENRLTMNSKQILLANHLSGKISEAACAYAVAQLCAAIEA